MTLTTKRLALLLAASLLALCAIGAPISSASDGCLDEPETGAQPGFGVAPGCFDGQVSDQLGAPFTQAGGHPYSASTQIDFNTVTDPGSGPNYPAELAKDVLVDLPPGLIGNPTGIKQCKASQLVFDSAAEEDVHGPLCPPESQVGLTVIKLNLFGSFSLTEPLPIFAMVPPPGVAARFGFNVTNVPVVLDAELRSGGDYGLSVNSRNISEGLAILGARVTFWGTPADPSHQAARHCPGAESETGGCASTAPLKPLLRNPTSCTPAGVGLTTTAHLDSWAHPGAFTEASFVSHNPPGFPEALPLDQWGAPQGPTGCDQVPFTPAISVQPSEHAASTPTGLAVDLTVPQDWSDPNAIEQSDLKKAVVTLPAGMTVNPAFADGLGACTSAQIALHSSADPTCPDNSKLGSLTIDTPLLDHSVPGSVYLAKQADNPFNSTIAMYLVAKDPVSGIVLKLAGKVEGDANGRLTTVFDNQPQLPFSHLHLELNGGPWAALVTPPTCATLSTHAELSGWAGNAPVGLDSSFQITSGPGGTPCANPRPFNPTFSAGLASQIASTSSPFTLKLTRTDAEQEFGSLSLDTPPGLAAVLKGVPYCPEAAIPSGACPAASQVGTSTVGAGVGPDTYYVPAGKVFLAGPYKGAPLSLVIAVPAVAGPFDLGTVVVRSAAYVDPTSAALHVVSDPIPSVLQGVAVHVRSVYVAIDRPGFMVAPTSCDPMAIGASIHGLGGASANPSNPFQMLLCNTLDFGPKLSLKLKGGTKRSKHPALKAVLTQPAGQANIARASVTLPATEFIDQNHINNPCTRVQFNEHKCPPSSVLGKARAFSPLLDKPLEGPVYFRANGGERELPDIVADLNGQIHVVSVGFVDAVHHKGSEQSRIRTTFAAIPDAPLSKVVIELNGGKKKGLLVNSANLCKVPNKAVVKLDAQNGKVYDTNPAVANSCGKGKKSRRGTSHR